MHRLHFLVGLAATAAFLATGLYMFFSYNHLYDLDASKRLLFRSSHIYILFAALLNLVVAANGVSGPSGWRAGFSRVGSALLLIAPALCILAFFRVPWLTGLARPYALSAVISSLAGVRCHVMSGLPRRS
jgi:hypothetical protein